MKEEFLFQEMTINMSKNEIFRNYGSEKHRNKKFKKYMKEQFIHKNTNLEKIFQNIIMMSLNYNFQLNGKMIFLLLPISTFQFIQ